MKSNEPQCLGIGKRLRGVEVIDLTLLESVAKQLRVSSEGLIQGQATAIFTELIQRSEQGKLSAEVRLYRTASLDQSWGEIERSGPGDAAAILIRVLQALEKCDGKVEGKRRILNALLEPDAVKIKRKLRHGKKGLNKLVAKSGCIETAMNWRLHASETLNLVAGLGDSQGVTEFAAMCESFSRRAGSFPNMDAG